MPLQTLISKCTTISLGTQTFILRKTGANYHKTSKIHPGMELLYSSLGSIAHVGIYCIKIGTGKPSSAKGLKECCDKD